MSRCKVPNCAASVEPGQILCAQHWQAVAPELKEKIGLHTRFARKEVWPDYAFVNELRAQAIESVQYEPTDLF